MKEAVCCCGHFRSSHNYPLGSTHCRVCHCKTFTDQRISHRRAASKATREAGPKAEIIKLLEERGIRFWRMNSGDTILKTANRKARKIKGNVAGTPDIQIIIPWNLNHESESKEKLFFVVWIEVKSQDGKPSKEQVEFQAKAEALGETYLICRSAQDVENWLKENL